MCVTGEVRAGPDEDQNARPAGAQMGYLLRPVDAPVVAHANVVLRLGVPVLGRLDPGGQRLALLRLERRVR